MVYFLTDKKEVWNHHGKKEKEVHGLIRHLKNWIDGQDHLEETPCDTTIHHFLTNCKYDVDRTKQVIDTYHSKWAIMPEICKHIHPFHSDISDTYKSLTAVPLPRLTSNLHRVTFVRFNEGMHGKFELNKAIAAVYMHINEVKIMEDVSTGEEYIFDYKHIHKDMIDQFNQTDVKKIEFILKDVYGKQIQGFHFINSNKIADDLIEMFRTFCFSFKNKVYVHETLEDLYKYIPRTILPKDYGGDEDSLDDLNKLWLPKLEQHTERFDKLHGETERSKPVASGEFNVCDYYKNHLKINHE